MITGAAIIGVGIPYSVYSRQAPGVGRGHSDFALSRGEIVNFASNPKRWLDGYREEEHDTFATKWGSAVECLAGLSGKFDEAYAVAPAEYTDTGMECPRCKSVTYSKTCRTCKCDRVEIKIMKPWNSGASICEQWERDKGEREVLKFDFFEKVKLAVAALESDIDVVALFNCSQNQVMVSGFWSDGGIEIPIRCLIDLVPDAAHSTFGLFLADLKTTKNGCPDTLANVIDSYGYDVQAALSIALYNAATGDKRCGWILPTQENVAPYHTIKPMPALTVEFLEYGRKKLESALTLYAQCLATNKWPSYSTGNRIVIDPCQYVGPETLWKYRNEYENSAQR